MMDPVTVNDDRAKVNDPRVTIEGAWVTEPRWDNVYASGDPGGCMPGCVFLKTSMFVKWPSHRGDAGCYLHNGTTDSGRPSFHSRGRAIDIWIASGHLDVGTAMFDWCVANRAALGLNEVIFNSRIWRADHPERGIHAYTANRHTDHIHIAINLDGARMQLPWYRHQEHIPTPEEIQAFLRWLEANEMDVAQDQRLKDLHGFMSSSKAKDGLTPLDVGIAARVRTIEKSVAAIQKTLDVIVGKLP